MSSPNIQSQNQPPRTILVMSSILMTLLALAVHGAQTNPVVAHPVLRAAPAAAPSPMTNPDVLRQLASYSNQLAAVNREIKTFLRESDETRRHYELRELAGQIKTSDIRARQNADREIGRKAAALERRKAAIQLAEFEYRKRLRLPQQK